MRWSYQPCVSPGQARGVSSGLSAGSAVHPPALHQAPTVSLAVCIGEHLSQRADTHQTLLNGRFKTVA